MSHGGWIQRIGNSAFETSQLLGLYNLSVVEIADAAFQGSEKLSAVTLFTPNANENGLKIGDYAFAGCSALTAITFGSGKCIPTVTKLGDYAFTGCSSLATLTMTNWPLLSAIGEGCFMNCSKFPSTNI